ncbi:hypothetical protein KCU81_g214, partial [Aureobasidium melanogenum]
LEVWRLGLDHAHEDVLRVANLIVVEDAVFRRDLVPAQKSMYAPSQPVLTAVEDGFLEHLSLCNPVPALPPMRTMIAPGAGPLVSKIRSVISTAPDWPAVPMSKTDLTSHLDGVGNADGSADNIGTMVKVQNLVRIDTVHGLLNGSSVISNTITLGTEALDADECTGQQAWKEQQEILEHVNQKNRSIGVPHPMMQQPCYRRGLSYHQQQQQQ